MARWLRLQLANGAFEGRRLISPENLAETRTPKVAISETASYALGWVVLQTPGGRVIWHNGGTLGFGAHVGFLPDKDVGVIVLSNEENQGFPDALASWLYDRLCGNPAVDHMAKALERARSTFASKQGLYRRPENARPSPGITACTGEFVSPTLGRATLRAEGHGLMLELKDTGAQLALEPFDGAVLTVQLLPHGRFTPVVQLLGPQPLGFAQFQADEKGRLSTLGWFTEGQSYAFHRE